jgi:hypothetical protein
LAPLALLLAQDRAHALVDHQAADGREQQHVGYANREIELAERAQQGEQPDADRRAEDAGRVLGGCKRETGRIAANNQACFRLRLVLRNL